MNRLSLVCIERSIGEVKNVKCISTVVSRGRVMKHRKSAMSIL